MNSRLDDPPLSPAHEIIVRKRSAEYHRNPTTAISLEEMERRLLSAKHAKGAKREELKQL